MPRGAHSRADNAARSYARIARDASTRALPDFIASDRHVLVATARAFARGSAGVLQAGGDTVDRDGDDLAEMLRVGAIGIRRRAQAA